MHTIINRLFRKFRPLTKSYRTKTKRTKMSAHWEIISWHEHD